MTDDHEEKKTLTVDVEIPEHADRTETSLYRRTRKEALKNPPTFVIRQDPGRCWICHRTAEECGESLETHHFIERCFAEADIDWEWVKKDFPHFDWDNFDPANPYIFIDDMTAQGWVLCRECHIGADLGMHYTTFPLLLIRRYLKPGTKYSPTEIIPARK